MMDVFTKVTCELPFDIVGQSSSEISVQMDGNNSAWIVWPVEIYAMDGNCTNFLMHVFPEGLNGQFVWTETCCPVSGSGPVFGYSCDGNCYCGGCQAEGEYRYEGFRSVKGSHKSDGLIIQV